MEILNIPLNVYKVQLLLKRNCNFPFYHGMHIYSLCCSIFDKHPLGLDVIIYPSETGFINYKQDDLYNFALTTIGNNPIKMNDLTTTLENTLRNAENGDISSFFSLNMITEEEVKQFLPYKNNKEIELRFITPLRHSRRKKEKGKTFFDPSFFDPGYFLERLFYRVQDLSAYFNIKMEKNIVSHFPDCRLLSQNLMWVDVPAQNETLGGIIGSVKFSGELDDFWLNLLWLGQYIHAGRNSSSRFRKILY